jgi:pyruvate dehydrogenase E1 component
VNRYHVVVAALKSLADLGEFDMNKVDVAIAKYNIDTDTPNPWSV